MAASILIVDDDESIRDLLLASGIDPALLDDVDGTLPQRAVDDQMKKPARGGLSAST